MKSLTQKLQLLGKESGTPCVTISFNTHRTHPDNEQDRIVLKKLLKEAEAKVIEDYGKRPMAALLHKLESVADTIDINYNLDSLHLFLSNDTEEIIRTTWPVQENEVYVGEHFMVRPLIKAVNRSEDYYILELSEGGVHLYEALNEHVTGEVTNEDFPFGPTPHYIIDSDKASDPKQVDNMAREYFNKVDKAVVRAEQESGLPVVVVSTRGNYDLLRQVADVPHIYLAHVPLNYNEAKPHQLSEKAWEAIKDAQYQKRTAAITELHQAVGDGQVLTDLQEIYRAALDGRGDLLVVNQDYSLPVIMTGDRTFDLAEDIHAPGVDKDVISTISWNVLSQGGRVVYTDQKELDDLGKVALKARY